MEQPYPPFHLGSWFSLRISLSGAELMAGCVQKLLEISEAIVGVEHSGEGLRTHCHFGIYNSKVNHDTFRKKVKAILAELFPNLGVEGNALFSVKKWDGQEKYLVYMIKGKYALIANCYASTTHVPPIVISDNDYERLKRLWVSKTVEENDYIAFKNSTFFPKFPILDNPNLTDQQLKQFQVLKFEMVVDACKDYARSFNGGYINSKARFVATNLISNFCLFHKIKILPYRI